MKPEFFMELGRSLERQAADRATLADHENRITQVEGKIHTAESWIARLIAAATLWAASLGLTLNAETFAGWLVQLFRAFRTAG
jgi:hypothetical protein